MGRPAEHDSAATRQALVFGAYRVLAMRGFEGLRTRDVAARAGVNVATLHHHFPTKEALVRGVVGHALGRFRSTLPVGAVALEQLRGHFTGLRRLARSEPELFAVMAELSLRARRDAAIAAIIRKTDAAWSQSLEAILATARAEGGLDPAIDPAEFAALTVAALKGAFMLRGGRSETAQLDRALRPLERWLGLVGGPARRARSRSSTRT